MATRTGILEATQSESTKKKSKTAKTQIDIIPIHSTRYIPQVDDIVIGTVVMRNNEFFTVDINAGGYATLHSLEFQGSTKGNKPRYEEGTLVYCRVLQADKLAKTQLSCISPLDKKAWNSGEAFFGELKGGFVKDFPIRFCRELLEAEGTQESETTAQYLLNRLGEKFKFQINIGFNGKIWVSGRMADTVFIMNAFERCVLTNGNRTEIDKLLNVLG